MGNDRVSLHLAMHAAHQEREQDAADERRAEMGIEGPTAKPDNIPEDLWNRMGDEFKQHVKQSDRTYNPDAIRNHLDALEDDE